MKTVSILLIVILTIPLTVLSNRVNAVSIYDNLVAPVTSIDVGFSSSFFTLSGSNYLQYFTDYCPTNVVSSFKSAVERGDNYAILQQSNIGGSERFATLVWQNNSSGDFTGAWYDDDTVWSATKGLRFSSVNGATAMKYHLSYDSTDDPAWYCSGSSSVSSFDVVLEDIDKGSNNMLFGSFQPFISTFNNFDYPLGYAGLSIENGSTDNDEDGLSLLRELQQGTSDGVIDSDGDGINDLKESVWFEDRDDVFCKTTTTPYVCTYPDPIKKDVYVEIDWLKDALDSVFKPTVSQLELVEDMFANKDIKLHFDIGDFGGGNEIALDSTILQRTRAPLIVDYYDLIEGGDGVAKQFSGDRDLVWRYMVTGYGYPEDLYSSGWAQVMTDISFISIGHLSATITSNKLDQAVANTIAHELGHNLCLSNIKVWDQQPEDCVFEGIDQDDTNSSFYNLEDYESVMNYRYQLTTIDDMGKTDFSDGLNGSDDHDDWGVISQGISQFINRDQLTDYPSGARMHEGAVILARANYDQGIIENKAPLTEEQKKAAEDALKQYENSLPQDSSSPATVSPKPGSDTSGTTEDSFSSEGSKEVYHQKRLFEAAMYIVPTVALITVLIVVLLVRKKGNKPNHLRRNR